MDGLRKASYKMILGGLRKASYKMIRSVSGSAGPAGAGARGRGGAGARGGASRCAPSCARVSLSSSSSAACCSASASCAQSIGVEISRWIPDIRTAIGVSDSSTCTSSPAPRVQPLAPPRGGKDFLSRPPEASPPTATLARKVAAPPASPETRPRAKISPTAPAVPSATGPGGMSSQYGGKDERVQLVRGEGRGVSD